jgi:outer membrane protein OmpA-like peptidoglycan-associated protein
MSGKTILFNTNKADIKNSSFALLKTIANVIQSCQSSLPNAKIAVSGHTDSRGSDEYNLLLSEDRANAVKKYLTRIGVSNEIITSKGYGESQPVAPNDTPEGRTKNRRITFSVK